MDITIREAIESKKDKMLDNITTTIPYNRSIFIPLSPSTVDKI